MTILTITTTSEQDSRIADAFGKHLGLGRDATLAEVKESIIQFIRDEVFDQESASAIEAAKAGVPSIEPT